MWPQADASAAPCTGSGMSARSSRVATMRCASMSPAATGWPSTRRPTPRTRNAVCARSFRTSSASTRARRLLADDLPALCAHLNPQRLRERLCSSNLRGALARRSAVAGEDGRPLRQRGELPEPDLGELGLNAVTIGSRRLTPFSSPLRRGDTSKPREAAFSWVPARSLRPQMTFSGRTPPPRPPCSPSKSLTATASARSDCCRRAGEAALSHPQPGVGLHPRPRKRAPASRSTR
jgi:hypothetical protein